MLDYLLRMEDKYFLRSFLEFIVRCVLLLLWRTKSPYAIIIWLPSLPKSIKSSIVAESAKLPRLER